MSAFPNIPFNTIGPAIFRTPGAAFAVRRELGGRVFIPAPFAGEAMWFPPDMPPTLCLRHRIVAGLDGHLVTSEQELLDIPRGVPA